MIAAQRQPDHATIARFIERHQDAIGGLFGEVLTLCARRRPGECGGDRGRRHEGAWPTPAATRTSTTSRSLARSSRRRSRPTPPRTRSSARRRGDELPRSCARPAGPARPGCAKPRAGSRPSATPTPSRCRAIRPKRLKEAKRRLDEELWSESRANEAYERYRARGRMKDGRRFGRPPDPYTPPETPEGRINMTDPDSRVVKGLRGLVQGYNAQAVANERQIVLAAEVMTARPGLRSPRPDARRHPAPARPSWRHRPARGAAGRRRLLAPRADGGDRRRRHPGADPARRQQAQSPAPRLDRRPLRVHASRPGQRRRRRALPPSASR